MTPIKVYKGDTKYDIDFTLEDAQGDAFDLTGATAVLLKCQKQDSDDLKFSGAMSVVSPTDGTVRYNVAATDFDEAGDYYAEIQVTFTGGKIVTFGDFVVRCLSDLPR